MGKAAIIATGVWVMTMLLARPSAATVSMLAYDAEAKVLGAVVISCLGETRGDFKLSEVVRLSVEHGGVVAQSYFFEEGRDTVLGALVAGKTAEQALRTVTNAAFDPPGDLTGYEYRQYGVVDTKGGHAVFSGNEAVPAVFSHQGTHDAITYVVAGNFLSEQSVVTTLSKGLTVNGAHLGQHFAQALTDLRSQGGGDKRCSPRSSDTGYVVLVASDGSTWEKEVTSEIEDPATLLLAAIAEQNLLAYESPSPAAGAGPVSRQQSPSSSACQFRPGPSDFNEWPRWLLICLLFASLALSRSPPLRSIGVLRSIPAGLLGSWKLIVICKDTLIQGGTLGFR